MARIIQFEENKYFNLDDRTLYINDSKVGSPLKGIPFRILEYLAQNSPNLINQDLIREKCWKENLGEGSVPYHIMKLRKAIQDIKISGKRNYLYIVETDGMYHCSFPIINTSINDIAKPSNEIDKLRAGTEIKDELSSFIMESSIIQNRLINAVLYCDCKWGACTFDSEYQNTNTCEGIIALLSSNEYNNYRDLVEDCLCSLSDSLVDNGLVSKSLGLATVVPTSMFIYLSSFIKESVDESVVMHLTNKIYEAKERSGWGIYVKKMGRNTNIGCTYWAITALLSNNVIANDLVQNTILSLFKYNGTYSFGRNIDEVNPRIPCLYSTSMMNILYSRLSSSNKALIANRFDYSKSLELITKYFDNPFFLLEEEGIQGIEIPDRINVHTVNWNHITIHYSLKALSVAITNNQLSSQEIITLLNRIIALFKDNTQEIEEKLYWNDPKISIEKGNRGKLIFPTMHAIMGLSSVIDAVTTLLENISGGFNE